MSSANDQPVSASPIADPRLERLMTIGKQRNDLLVKIKAASDYLGTNSPEDEMEAVQLAREELYRDFADDSAEAKALLPALDDIVLKLQEHERSLDSRRKMNLGLAKIEGLSGADRQKQFADAAASLQKQISEVQNLVNALDALERDLLTVRRAPLACPRCTSNKISYRITPSELGFTLYKCDECGNGWKITEFKLRLSGNQTA